MKITTTTIARRFARIYHPFLPPAGQLPPAGHHGNRQFIGTSWIFGGGKSAGLANRRLQPLGHISADGNYL